MKQTNNALKYLLAQYRAIFKNAYFKGLVSATVLTAGLAAVGTAQAAALTSADLPTDGSTVTIDGTANTNIYQSDVSGDLPLNGQLVINSGDAGNSGSTDNLFQASTAANLTGSKFGITIDSKTADANTVGLAIAVNNSTNTTDHFKVDIGSIDVTKGKLALGMASQSGSLFVSADSITIGTGTAISDTGNNTEEYMPVPFNA